ncbi:NRDE family protein [Planococcus lenghuensis]|uniref:NRDE family protein n=1 Tax=Planococcus lenghuensis TaxID=2213202 RepID=A0A1Q2L0N8_9BACL|nr:NRDE family protein [Planococcus lenghuensis]AQQ53999.1 hypothetical protein B0X71_13435 [Planococcus lenghuensis]
MCLINFQFHNDPRYKLVLAANRDEFYGRPTAPAHFWEDSPDLLAGRDLKEMGTWMGVTRNGRFAALTNFRDPDRETSGKRSRGEIVQNYLTGNESSEAFLQNLDPSAYNGFNILAGTPDALFYLNNVEGNVQAVSPGVHGVSNHFLDTPWPKVQKGKAGLRAALEEDDVNIEKLFQLLQDAEAAEDVSLPDTGVGIELERKLSPLFIRMPDYGTRASTVLTIDRHNQVTFIERIYEEGIFQTENRFTFSAG